MKLYTKRGDGGQTALCNGRRVSKDDLRVWAYGDVDELNAAIGLVRSACQDTAWSAKLRHVQDRLFVLGAELSNPDRDARQADLTERDVTALEGWIDEASNELAPLKNFILPGGSELAGRLHWARTVCRRAERSVVRLTGAEAVGPRAIPFLNRLSDLLFAWARLANQREGVEDLIWPAPPQSAQDAGANG